MFLIKAFGVLLVCTFAASEMITFKPFVKSRYSLRERTTTKLPMIKANETAVNTNPEVNIQTVSTQNPAQNWGTTTDNENSKNSDVLTTSVPSSQFLNIDATPTIQVDRKEISVENSQTNMLNTEIKTTKTPVTTTQTEWIYDYYASDDESPKRKK